MTLMFDSGMIMKEKLDASHSLGFKGYQGDHALLLLAVNKSHNYGNLQIVIETL